MYALQTTLQVRLRIILNPISVSYYRVPAASIHRPVKTYSVL